MKISLEEACYQLNTYFIEKGLANHPVYTCGYGKDELIVYVVRDFDIGLSEFMEWPVRKVVTKRFKPA
jgi:hypothetical protein